MEVFMESLVTLLKEIEALLGQISAITANQTTILLQAPKTVEEENEVLALLEQMVEYKEELILEVEKKEQAFEVLYSQYKGQITNPDDIKAFKHYVAHILSLKEEIKEAEQANVMMMRGHAVRRTKQVDLPKNPKQVMQAYRNNVRR